MRKRISRPGRWVLMVGGIATGPAWAAQPATDRVALSCSDAKQVAASSNLVPMPARELRGYLRADGTPQQITSAYRLSGPCASQVSGYNGDLLGFSAGVVLNINEGRLRPLDTRGREALYSRLAPAAAQARGPAPVLLQRAQCPHGLASAEVAAEPDAQITRLMLVKTLPNSDVPRRSEWGSVPGTVRAMSFLPHPDTAGGRLAIATEVDGEVQLVSMDFVPASRLPLLSCPLRLGRPAARIP